MALGGRWRGIREVGPARGLARGLRPAQSPASV